MRFSRSFTFNSDAKNLYNDNFSLPQIKICPCIAALLSELSDITPIKRGAGRLIPSKPRRGAMAAAPTAAAADNNATVKSLATRTLLGGGKTENTDKFLRLAGSYQYKSTY